LVLAHLRRCWSLGGREGLGLSLPSAELASAEFRRFQGVEKPIFHYAEVGKETEANGGHRGDRTLHRTRSRYDRRVRSVQRGVRRAGARVCNRRVRSLAGPARPVMHQKRTEVRRGRSDAGRVRSHTIGRVRSLKELTGLTPDAGTVASGRREGRVRSLFRGRGCCADRRVRSFEAARPVV
jgi:hypothetical protein